MRFNKSFIKLIILIAALSICAFPIVTITIYGLESASQIGDAFGGLTAPVLSLSALIMIVQTYFYQNQQDKNIQANSIFNRQFEFIVNEFEKISIIVTNEKTIYTNGVKKRVTESSTQRGKQAIDFFAAGLMNGQNLSEFYSNSTFLDSIINTFSTIDNLINEVQKSQYITETQLRALLSLISLFYSNNLWIDSVREAYFELQKGTVDDINFWFPPQLKTCIESINGKLNLTGVLIKK
jgi:uncharacterized membrane protein